MASTIDTITKRRKLKPRKEPYWHKIAVGRYVGYRKTTTGGTWHIRLRRPDGKQEFEPLKGIAEGQDAFTDAFRSAQKWISSVESMPDYRYTVEQCIDDYVAHLRVQNGEDSSYRVGLSMGKHLVPKLGEVEIAKLTTAELKRWRDGLVRVSDDEEDTRRSKDTANRVLGITKAAFNLAYRNGLVASDQAWDRIAAFKDVGENRKLFLTDNQVKKLLDATSGSFHELLRAAVLTGSRYGELAKARVRDLDVFNGSLHLDGKTGARDCYLSDDALAYFRTLAKDKLPSALLLPRDDGEQWGKAHQSRPMREAVQRAKLPRDTVFYSLRHYHISKALLAGIPAQMVGENTGTSIRMLEKHYGKFMATDRRKMMNSVALTTG